VIVFLNIDRTI